MRRTPALRLLDAAKPYGGLFALGVVAMLAASLLDGINLVILVPLLKTLFGTAGPLATGGTDLENIANRLLSPVIGGADRSEIATRLVVLLLAGVLLKNVFVYAAGQISVAMQEGLVRDLRVRLYRHLLGVELGFLQRTRQGQLIAGVIADADQCKEAVTAALARFVQNIAVIAVFIGILGTISWRLTLVTLAAAPILVLGIQQLLKRLRRYARQWAEERGRITATVTERLGAIKLIRGYGGEDLEAQEFERQADRYRKQVIRTQRFANLSTPMSEIFGVMMIILIIWVATNSTLSGGIGPEVTIVFLAAALRIMSPIKSLSQFPTSMSIALGAAERVFGWLDLPLAEGDDSRLAVARFEREIDFDRVTFSFDGGEPVLRDVSFKIPKGNVVAIVGPSGAGKTTMLELLPRFHEPTSGEIRFDGVAISKFTRSSVRSLLGLVSQDTVILNDTVFANIAYARPGATREQVEEAAKLANAHEFIEKLPERFETMLGERGTRLSGGQRQRIAIARALLRDPPILILDEATSALDTESERLVQEAIDRVMENRTVLVVAHRLATVRHADEIIVLDQARVVERGHHSELVRAGGLYRRLHDLQFRLPEEVA